ncbi:MAG: Ig-like domain-containing protein [Verrucomicrobia bacterium]|nr:Ig-like domain-containing protein [Verrucomicrobiota bacterium]
MKFLLNRIKFTLFVLIGVALIRASTCSGTTSYQLQAAKLQDAGGAPASGLVIFVASRSNAVFSLPTTTNFVSGDDIILGSYNAAGGELDVVASGLVLANGWDTGDALAIYWFPTLTTSSTFPIPPGTPYGIFSDNNSLAAGDGSDSWVTPGDGSAVTLRFLTASYGGSNPETYGLASSVVAGGNNPPVANPDGPFLRAPGLSLKIAITNLLANDTDADTNVLTFTGIVGNSTNNFPLTTNAQYVFYPSNAGNVSDRFSYTISDGQGGVSTGLVYIAISTDVYGQALGITNAAGNFIATFAGIPGYSYTVQRATNVNFSLDLTNVVTIIAPTNGLFRWTNSPPIPPTAYYRLRYNSP